MGNEKLEASKAAGGAHYRLGLLVGQWQGTLRTWFEPEKLADESPVRGNIRSVLDGRFVVHEYESAFSGKPIQGIAIYGYHLDRKRFESAWVDSFGMGTGIMFSEGDAGASPLSVLGSYEAGTERWGWRTEIEIVDPDQIVITAYNIPPGGTEAKANETRYARVPEER